MVSKALCNSVYRGVSEVHASGEFSKVIFTSPYNKAQEMFAELVDE